MPRILVLATRNPGKLREMQAILAPLGFDLRSVAGFPAVPEIEETGETFEANARLKALAVARATGEWALADDSGIEVDALGGRPGVRSARYAGEPGSDAANNQKLLEELKGTPPVQRTARYRAVIAVADPARILCTAEGACEGRIQDEPRGTGGFGYDPHFLLPELGLTMAELPAEEKNRISHRGKALRALFDRLSRLTVDG